MERAAMNAGLRLGGRNRMRVVPRGLVALLAASAGLALSSRALADTYYVAQGMTGKTGLTPEDAFDSIKEAVEAINDTGGGVNTIIVAPGDYQKDLEFTKDGHTITIIADTMASHWAKVADYIPAAAVGDRSVALNCGLMFDSTSTYKLVGFYGFRGTGMSPITVQNSASVTFEDFAFVERNLSFIEFNGPATLTLRRGEILSDAHILLLPSKDCDGASIEIDRVRMEATGNVIRTEAPGSIGIAVRRSSISGGNEAFHLAAGKLSVDSTIFTNVGGMSAVWCDDPSGIHAVTLNHNTFYNVNAVVDGKSLRDYSCTGLLPITLTNNLVAYSGMMVNEDCSEKGDVGPFTSIANVEWLSQTDPATDGKVKSASSINDLLPGFLDAQALDLRLSENATDVLGMADQTVDVAPDFFGNIRTNNTTSDIGAIERRPVAESKMHISQGWLDELMESGVSGTFATQRTGIDRPLVHTFVDPSTYQETFDGYEFTMLTGGKSYEEDTGLANLLVPTCETFSRPNLTMTNKTMVLDTSGGWYDSGTIQQFVVESGGRDLGCELMFDVWVADATTSPAVVTVKVNGVTVWRHTVLAGAGDDAPPLDGWTLPQYPTQSVGNLYGSSTKNDLGFMNVKIAGMYKNLYETKDSGIDVIEFSVDNCGGWALDNVRIMKPDEMAAVSPSFRDVTLETGFGSFLTSGNAGIVTRPAILADLTGSATPDILVGMSSVTTGNGATRKFFYDGKNSSYTEEYTSKGTASIGVGLGILDIDNDGEIDLVEVPASTSPVMTSLISASFTSLAHPVVTATTGAVRGTAVADFNGDGWCDLLLLSANRNAVVLNSGSVADATQTWTGYDDGSVFAFPTTSNDIAASGFASTADVNHDGYPDVATNAATTRIWWSSVNPYTNAVTYAHNARGISYTPDATNPVGLAWGDFDNDGDLDLFVPNRTSHGQLWQNPGADKVTNFTNVATTKGLANTNLSWSIASKGASATWGDYDNDGDLDLAMTTGRPGTPDAIRIFANSGSPNYTFTRVYDFGADVTTEGGDIRFVDYDNNGYLDLLVTSDSDNYPVRLFRNELRENNTTGDADTFLKVRVLGRGAGGLNAAGVGARVELWDELGTTLLARRDVGLSQGLGGMDSLWVHFGVPDYTSPHIVRVYGPGGYVFETSTIPSKTASDLNGTTVNGLLTMDERVLRPGFNVKSYVEVAPDRELEETEKGKK